MNLATSTNSSVSGPSTAEPPPSGLLAVLFTDVAGSTAIKQQLGDRGSERLFSKHDALVRHKLSRFPGGQEIETAGDSFLMVFTAPSAAVQFALELQTELKRLAEESGVAIADRIGIHVGEVVMRPDAGGLKPRELYGMQVDTCARVMSLAAGGQILMTRFAFDNARQILRGQDLEAVGPVQWLNHGRYLFKGLEEPLEVCEVRLAAGGAVTPPTSSEKAQRYAAPGEEPVLGWRPAIGQRVGGTQWSLEEKLGEGGFGEVWLGRHLKLKEQRVFKFCFRADRVRALKREMTLFRVLRERVGEHRNIVRLLEVNLDKAPFYLEEEYLSGRDLRTWCEAQGGIDKVPMEVRLEIVAQAAEGLAAAHEAGIIHRDVKPGNILVSDQWRVTSEEQPAAAVAAASPLVTPRLSLVTKLTDFGIGQVVSAEYLAGVTATGFTGTIVRSTSSSHSGTQAYMSPEVLMGRAASAQSDIHSLGVVLYQLLVSDFTRPVTTDWARDISESLLKEDLQRCFAGRPEERFRSAGELAKNVRSLAQRRAARASATKEAFERGTARIASLAVLPFVNMSADPENEFLSDGIAEDLLTALSRMEGLRVPGRTSCFSFKGKTDDLRQIGQRLSVETVLEGSVQKAGNRLRVTAQLIKVADGFHLWSERYDREMADVFAIQDDITQAIVGALLPKLATEHPAIRVKTYTGNLEAYELCLRGRYHMLKWTPEGFAISIRLFEQAVALDPNNPLAQAGLSVVYMYASYLGGLLPSQGMPKAQAAALRAIELDETLPAGHLGLACVLFLYERDWARADAEFARALELDPKHVEAHTFRGMSYWARLRHEEAVAELQKAIELDPFAPDANSWLPLPLVCLHKFDEAHQQTTRMLEMEPSFWMGYIARAFAEWRNGLRVQAVQDAEKAASLERGPASMGFLCWYYARAGRRDEARQTAERLQQMALSRYVQQVWMAVAHDGLGEEQEAVACVRRAMEEHDLAVMHLRGFMDMLPGLLAGCSPVLDQAGL